MTLPATLANSFDRSFQDHLNEPGGGQFSLQLDDPEVADITYGLWVPCSVDGGATTCFTWRIENIHRVAVAEGEEKDQIVRYSGQGLASLFTQGIVYPATGLGRRSPDARYFNFASISLFDTLRTGKPDPVAIEQAQVGPVWITAPRGWPDPDAWWVWSELPDEDTNSPVGDIYMTAKFETEADGRYTVYVTSDDAFELWIDEQPTIVLPLATSATMWNGTFKAEIELDAGEHVVGVKASNADYTLGTNPSGLICSIFELTNGGADKGAVVCRTGPSGGLGGWKVIAAYPANEPGGTPGQIFRILYDEGAARTDATAVDDHWTSFNLAFTDENDSNGDPWPTAPAFSCQVGTDYLSVLRQLAEEGYCDFRIINPGEFTWPDLALYIAAGEDRSGDVVLEPAVNLTSLEHEGTNARQTTALLVRYQNGYIEQTDASMGTAGRREASLSLGSESSTEQVAQIASQTFARTALPEVATSAATHPSTGPFCFIDFDPGDWITAPDETGTPASVRCRAGTVSEDEDGVLAIVPELNTVRQEFLERVQRTMRTMTPGTLAGTIETGAPPLPVPGFTDYVDLGVGASELVDVAYDIPPVSESVLTWDEETNGGAGAWVPSGGVETKETGWAKLDSSNRTVVTNNDYRIVWDDGGGSGFTLGSPASRLVADRDGSYLIRGQFHFAAAASLVGAALQAELYITHVGTSSTQVIGHDAQVGANPASAPAPMLSVVAFARLEAGDYIEFVARQWSGVDQTISAGTAPSAPKLTVVRLGESMSNDSLSEF